MDTEAQLKEISAGVWAYIQPDGGWMVNNMGLISGANGLTSVDVTSTEQRTEDYLGSIKAVSPRPVRRVLLTHAHPDHCNGLSLLPEAEIVAHHSVAEDLSRPHSVAAHIFTPFHQGNVAPRIPTMTFGATLTLDTGDHRVEVIHPQRSAHTRGDAYVWLPDSRVLFTGDLVFNGGTPFALSGSPSGWLETLDEMAALKPRVVVPGHGAVGGPELFEPVVDYLEFLWNAAVAARDRGLTPLEAARQIDLGKFSALPERERIVGNLHRALAELNQTDVDFSSAWEDMYQYNGARSLECHA